MTQGIWDKSTPNWDDVGYMGRGEGEVEVLTTE
jgi:hypothetical protein